MYQNFVVQDGCPHFPTDMGNDIYAAWQQFASGKAIPKRKDIDPLLIPKKYLSGIWLYEYEAEMDSYRQVLAGENIRDAWQETDKNPLLEDFLDSETVKNVKARWDFVRETPAIAYYCLSTEGDFKYTERIYFPVSDQEGNRNYIFGCSVYERLRGSETRPPFIDMKDGLLFKISPCS